MVWLRRLSNRQWLAMLLSLALLARALIPVGFMPIVVDGTARLVLCDGGVDHRGHASHPHSSGSTPSGDRHCPFALSGLTALLPATAGSLPTDAMPDAPEAGAEDSVQTEPPRRHAAPRGPPTLA